MENLLYINAVLPYTYLGIFFMMNTLVDKYKMDSSTILSICGLSLVFQLLLSLIVSLISKDINKLLKINLIVKLIQIPYYIAYFIVASLCFMILMELMGIGIFLLPIFIMIDIAVFLTTVIPAEIGTIKLKLRGKLSVGKTIFYLIFNTWYIVDIFLAFKLRKELDNE